MFHEECICLKILYDTLVRYKSRKNVIGYNSFHVSIAIRKPYYSGAGVDDREDACDSLINNYVFLSIALTIFSEIKGFCCQNVTFLTSCSHAILLH